MAVVYSRTARFSSPRIGLSISSSGRYEDPLGYHKSFLLNNFASWSIHLLLLRRRRDIAVNLQSVNQGVQIAHGVLRIPARLLDGWILTGRCRGTMLGQHGFVGDAIRNIVQFF